MAENDRNQSRASSVITAITQWYSKSRTRMGSTSSSNYTRFRVAGKEDSKKDSLNQALIVTKIHPFIKVNGTLHHTSKYNMMKEGDNLVIRRGQPFKIGLDLSRAYQHGADKVSFTFEVTDEEKTSHGQKTIISIPLLKEKSTSQSSNAVLDTSVENQITVQITFAATCVVAKWKLDVDTTFLKSPDGYRYNCKTPFYILFNAWCPQDEVYMNSDEWKQEAILEDMGLLWKGSFKSFENVAWQYSQFEPEILDCSLYVIKHVGGIQGQARSDPVETTRGISAAVSSVDGNCVVDGNWSGDYKSGTPPNNWLGSLEILQQYYKTKKPVKFGQCWVISGVVTTICRAIGIPSRPVTNYKSAHGNHGSATVNVFVDSNGTSILNLNDDLIWNFHVWNEVWMQRPDLGKQYGGWQAIDATSQEINEDMNKGGPTSLVAVKYGEINMPYDTNSLYAEVNADTVYWEYVGPTEPLKLLRKDTELIGKFISTKAAGQFKREDITLTYKYEEKSKEERDTMAKVLKQSANQFSRFCLNQDFNDIDFKFELLDHKTIGDPFTITLVMNNRSQKDDYTLQVTLFVASVIYTGVMVNVVKKECFNNVVLNKKSEKILLLNVIYDEYSKSILDQPAFQLSCFAKVNNINYEYFGQDDLVLLKPDVRIHLEGNPSGNAQCKGVVSLSNPLPVALTKARFKVEAPGLLLVQKIKAPIPPGEKALINITFTPTGTSDYVILAKFLSNELNDCNGYLKYSSI